MNSLRDKIIVCLIGMSFLAVALGAFYSHLVLTERFNEVVMERRSDEFARDALRYYRDYGSSFELANRGESWTSFIKKMQERRPAPNSSPINKLPSNQYFATDLSGKVWIPNDDYAVGETVPERYLSEATPILDRGEIIGYSGAAGKPFFFGAEEQYLTDLRNSLLLSLILVAIIAIPLGIILGRRLTRPINNLNTAIRAMRPESMSQRVPITSNDEIGLLSESFNQMSGELTNYLEVTEQQKEKIEENEVMRQQGLVNISHELRTPLYRLVAQAQAMLDGIRPLDQNEMGKITSSLDYLSDLVNDLHDLALSDVQAFRCEIKPTDFAKIVRHAVEGRKEVFAAKSFSLTTSIPDELMIDADPTRLRQIVENLLSNCVKYTNPDGEICVTLSATTDSAELLVSDDGPGVTAKNMESLFDRFYRGEASRSRATGGTGLGLSLVKTCAEMHGGNALASHSAKGGLSIRVKLPRTPSKTQVPSK